MGRSLMLSRRTLIRGVCGSVFALPALEIMQPKAARAGGEAGPPKRFVMIYGGMSLGAPYAPQLVVPTQVGLGYDLPRAVSPLGAGPLPSDPGLGGEGLNVQDHVSIVSGLRIPWDTGSGIPSGGRTNEFHYNTMGPQTSGMRGGPGRKEEPNGPTADQVVADAIGGDSLFPSLSYRVQAASYIGSNSTGGADARISWRQGAQGPEPIDPISSPELAYTSLFGAWPGPDPEAAAASQFLLRRRKSAIDLVHGRLQTLIPRLGAADRQRLERHLDEVQGLIDRLDAIPPDGQGDCALPPDPGEDPPVAGAAIEYGGNGGDGAGYSNEDLRAEILFDLIAMAFACDLTRSAAVRMTFSQSFMQMGAIIGTPGAIHDHAHTSGKQIPYADAFGWHVKHFARLIAKLRDTQDMDGTTLLDHSAVVMLFEGGYGYDHEGESAANVTHSSENMVALVGGHAGGLNNSGGKHIVATGQHPAKAVVSAMVGCGVARETETLGEITGVVPELFE